MPALNNIALSRQPETQRADLFALCQLGELQRGGDNETLRCELPQLTAGPGIGQETLTTNREVPANAHRPGPAPR